MSEPIQVLFDFTGHLILSNKVFQVQEAAASKVIESTSAGSIADRGIKSSLTLYVLWLSSLDDLSPAAPLPAQHSVAPPPVHHPVAALCHLCPLSSLHLLHLLPFP